MGYEKKSSGPPPSSLTSSVAQSQATFPRRHTILSLDLPEAHQALAHLESLMKPDAYSCVTGMRYADNSKYVRWELPADLKTIYLMQITDVQFGHIQCRYERVLEYRDWILAAPNRFMLWCGDMIDASTKLSVGDPWENFAAPAAQVYKFCEIWAPARHRILGFVGGNHERRAFIFGDLGSEIAKYLRIPYSAGRQFVDIHFGAHRPFKISLWHGAGGARTKGAIAQTLDRFVQQGDSQLYLMGHLHQPMVMPMWKQYREGKSQRIALQKVIGAVGSSFLETWATYGEVAGYAAHDVLMACAELEANGKWQVNLR